MSTTSNTYSSTQNTQPNKQESGYVEQAANALSSAAATVSSYLPTNVTNAVSGLAQSTDPTTAYHNKQPHVGGVGDLGTQSTQDVARLPEERQNPDPYSTSGTTANIGAANPAFTNPSGVQSQYNNRVEGETFPSGTSGVGAPTSQTAMTGMAGGFGTAAYGVGGHSGQPGGVGDLGTNSTSDVAKLPEERANPDPLAAAPGAASTTTGSSQAMRFGVGGHPGYPGGVGDLGTQSTQSVALLPEERAHPDPYSESKQSTTQKVKTVVNDGLGGHAGRHHDITKDGSTGGHTGANYDLDHGLGMPHTRSTVPTSESTTNATEDAHQPPSHSQDRTESDQGSVPSPKEAGYPTGKPSLMDKMKGTAIVAKGKMSKDEEKIHAGQMLKETGKKVNPEEEARRGGSMDQSEY